MTNVWNEFRAQHPGKPIKDISRLYRAKYCPDVPETSKRCVRNGKANKTKKAAPKKTATPSWLKNNSTPMPKKLTMSDYFGTMSESSNRKAVRRTIPAKAPTTVRESTPGNKDAIFGDLAPIVDLGSSMKKRA